MPPARWSRIAVFWPGSTSWEPWWSIEGWRSTNITKKMREGEERTAKSRVEGKMKSRAGIYRLKIIVATSQRRALRSDIELFASAYLKVEKRRRSNVGFYALRTRKLDSKKKKKKFCLLRSGLDFYVAMDQKV